MRCRVCGQRLRMAAEDYVGICLNENDCVEGARRNAIQLALSSRAEYMRSLRATANTGFAVAKASLKIFQDYKRIWKKGKVK